MVKYSEEEKKEAEETLRRLLENNRIIYTVVRKVSQNGMYRHISCYVIRNNEPRNIDFQVSRLLDLPLKEDGIGIGGCGMDMGFAIVYDVGRALFPKGDGHTIIGRNGDKEPETDGGYLIKEVVINAEKTK